MRKSQGWDLTIKTAQVKGKFYEEMQFTIGSKPTGRVHPAKQMADQTEIIIESGKRSAIKDLYDHILDTLHYPYAEVVVDRDERFSTAIIELETLGCGHFDVEIHKTDEAKKAFTRKKINAYIDKFLKNFVR